MPLAIGRGLIVSGVLHALGAGQGIDADVAQAIGIIGGAHEAQGGAGHNADDVLVSAGHGQQVGVGVGEGFLGEQALVAELLQVLDGIEPLVLNVGHGDMAVLEQEHVAVALEHERVGEELGGGAAPAGGGDEGDLIGGVAVAVGVLLLEGLQHLIERIGGGGDFQTQILQPGLVDPHLVLGLVGRGGLDLRDGVDGAVRVGDVGQQVPVRALGDGLVHVNRQTLLIVGLHVQQSARIAIGLRNGVAQVADIHVRQLLAGGNHDVQLIVGINGRQIGELEADIGALFDGLGVDVVLVILNVIAGLNQDSDGGGLGASPDGVLAGGAQVALSTGEADRRDDQGDRQRQNQKLLGLHRWGSSFIICIYSARCAINLGGSSAPAGAAKGLSGRPLETFGGSGQRALCGAGTASRPLETFGVFSQRAVWPRALPA